jgi:hypothetical protein
MAGVLSIEEMKDPRSVGELSRQSEETSLQELAAVEMEDKGSVSKDTDDQEATNNTRKRTNNDCQPEEEKTRPACSEPAASMPPAENSFEAFEKKASAIPAVDSYASLIDSLKEEAARATGVIPTESDDSFEDSLKEDPKISSTPKVARPDDPKKRQTQPPTTIVVSSLNHGLLSDHPKVITTSSTPGNARGRSTSPSSVRSRSGSNLRRGKWTVEEETYVARVIQDFNSGFLDAPAGTTLRTYLSEKLQCDPMRITKKFTGDSCIGKRVFHPAVRSPSNGAAIDKAQVSFDDCIHTKAKAV